MKNKHITNNENIWEHFYKERSAHYWPSEDVVAFCENYIPEGKLVSKRIIDVGCGAGRNLWFLGNLGAEIYGIDSSKSAIKKAQSYLTSKNLQPHLEVSNSTSIPYPDNYFDLGLIWGVFHYLSLKDQGQTKAELTRVLKKDSWVIFSLRSIHDFGYRKGKKARDNTFNHNRPEWGTIQMEYWNESQARTFFDLENILLGERIRAPIGRLNAKSAHWLIAGKIKKD